MRSWRASLLWAGLGVAAISASPGLAQFHTLETPDLRLVYEPVLQSYLAPHVVACFENSMTTYRRLFGFEPSEPVTVILNDLSDHGHGAAFASPWNTLLVSIAPIDYAFETYPANERMNTLMNHEVCHIVALDRAAGPDRFWRALFFGKVSETAEHPESIVYSYLTTPRKAAPRWYHEGLAVFVETWMAGGIGRAQGAYDEMVFRSMVRDGTRFYDPLALVSEGTKVDFMAGANAYLYGTRFVSYLAYRYSPEHLLRWMDRSAGSRAYFASQFRAVFGLGLDEAWSDWIEWEHEFQRANLDSIRLYPTTPFRDLSDRALGSASRAFFDAGSRKLFVAANYPGALAHIASIDVDDGRVERLQEVKGPSMYTVTSLARDPDRGSLFFTTDNNDWRDLCVIGPDGGEAEVLMKDIRIGDLSFCPADSSLWGVRHLDGISTLVRIPSPYEEWDRIHSWPYGTDIYDIDVSPDGRLVSASVAEIDGRQSLRVFDVATLSEGDTSPLAARSFGSSIPSNFVFAPDGRRLYGSSYYTGVSNIFRWDFAADSLDAVSNCETGFFRPIPIGGDSLIVFRYTGEGFVPSKIRAVPLEDVSATTFLGERIASERPVVQSWLAGSPARVNVDSLVTRSGEYRSLRSMRLASVFPIVEGYKSHPAPGVYLEITDPVFLNRADLAMSYSPGGTLPTDERFHVEANYERFGWTARFRYNDADFYDLFGPTQVGRKGYALGVDYEHTLVYDPPRSANVSVGVTGYDGLERLPFYQNVETSANEMLVYYARADYRNEKFSIGAVDYEKGVSAELAAGGTYLLGTAFPRVRADLGFGFPFLFSHSSLWLRSSAGHAFGDRTEPSANYYFGGFGNNWVDRGSIKRYREHYSLPGWELNELPAHNYGRALLEWNLPPWRFGRLGRAAFYATWIRAALFAAGVIANPDFEPERSWAGSAGVQVDLRLTMFANQNLTLSGGYAVGLHEGERHGDELMISLKIL